ncbi:hypothetical protein [Georgenia sp. AZ-5]|uniref:hypothetical protein n=1 Tax=Georgenia sp. AZ-5 TaxID=3367526 RepID=UPI003753F64B
MSSTSAARSPASLPPQDTLHLGTGRETALTKPWSGSRAAIVILGQSAGGDFFQTDATGMLSAFYSPEHQVISSHQNLLAESVGGLGLSRFGEPGWLKKHRSFTFPGLYTRFAGVWALPANVSNSIRTPSRSDVWGGRNRPKPRSPARRRRRFWNSCVASTRSSAAPVAVHSSR